MNNKIQLRPYQEEARKKVEDTWLSGTRRTLLVLPTGCHDPEQGILMADGSVKKAKDVVVGDRLMGDDGKARTVLRLHTGEKPMFCVKPVKGEPFVVTEDHVLPLVRANQKTGSPYPSQMGGQIDCVTIKDYMKRSKWFRHIHKLYRSDEIYEFEGNDGSSLTVDPYFIGFLLGDGNVKYNSIGITTPDHEIAEYMCKIAVTYDAAAKIKVRHEGTASTYFLARVPALRKGLKDLGIRGKGSSDKEIPFRYMTAPKPQRLQLLAGLLDADGSLTKNGYDFISASHTLAKGIAFVARSLGLAAYITGCSKSAGDWHLSNYWRVSISGNCDKIPCRIARRQAGKRRQKKDVLRTGIESITPAGTGPYVGFTVDGNNRYLLDDFTVTHNCGKTIVFAKIAADMVRQGKRVLILAHRGELLEQAADKIKKTTGLGCAVEKAESSCLGEWYSVVVGSVQSMQQDKRLRQFNKEYFPVIIVDEAHHALSSGYQQVLNHFESSCVLGVTATPDRGDMRNLGQYFESLAYEYSLPKAIKEGYLSPIQALTIPLKLDISQVGIQSGDFKTGEIGTALDPYLPLIAENMKQYCWNRKTVVFLPLIATSQKFKECLVKEGFRAAEVNGNSKDRAEILKDFDEGKYNVLCNSMLLTEGWDCPSVDCIIVLRPTKVRGLYSQMVGRGTRLYPGKKELLLIDFLWLTERHELCHPASLICEDPDVARQLTKNLEEEPGRAVDLEEAEKKASEDVVAQREEALAKQLAEMKRRKKKLVDPLQFEMSIQAEDLSGYVPAFGWEAAPPSQKQLDELERRGICPDEIGNAGKAAMLIERLKKRQTAGMTTPKQIRFLEGRGFQHVGEWDFESARKLIDRYAANGWMTPPGIHPHTYKPEPKFETDYEASFWGTS